MVVRVGQQVLYSLSATSLAHVQASQIIVDVLAAADGDLRVSQLLADVLSTGNGSVRSAQYLADALISAGRVRVAQFNLQVLIWSQEVGVPQQFPILPGLSYSVIKRPKWFTGIGTAATGRETRVAYAQSPLWEFELTYTYLPDQQTATSATASDLKALVGFYLSMSGSFSGFTFQDPDDYVVSHQVLGETDGTTTTWVFVRTYGGSHGTGTEPVGWLDLSVTPIIYLDGVVVSPTLYSLVTTAGCQQQVRFNTAPTTGKALTASFQFFYSVRFAEDHQDFEKFMDKLWSTAKLTLMSQRD